MNHPQVMADRNHHESSAQSNGREENGFPMGESGGDEAREKQPNKISQGDHEKERARFVMPYL
jgi:hypothetical protein